MPFSVRNMELDSVGCEGTSAERVLREGLPRCARHFGTKEFPDLENLAMFKLPAYDPVGIAILGFGIF